MGASSDAKGDIGMSSKGESFSDIADMDIDDNGYDDDYDYSTSIRDLGEGFLKNFCTEAAIAFFNEYGLISHQINSYNDFINNGIQRVFDSFGEIIVEPGYDPSKKGESEWRYASVKFGKVTLGMPSFWGGSDDEKEYKMLPRHARLQNMSYASKMKVNITVEVYTQKLVSSDKFKTGKAQYLDKKILSTDTRDIIIGSVPVMVKSDLCWMKDFEKGDCDFDHGGYFIIKGAEKTFIAQEQSCLKRLLITNNQGLTVAYRSEVKRHRLIIRLVGISKLENIEGVEKVLTVYFMSTEIPVWIWFFALGVSSDREVMNLIDYDSEDASISNILFASIRDADKLNDKGDGGFRRGKNALKYVDEVIRKTAFPPGESMEECISLYLFPNLKGLKQKARFLGYMVKSLLQAYAGRRKCDNRDDFRNKRLDLAGELLERELKAHIGHARRRMAKALQRDLYGDRAVRPIEHYLDASIVTNGISRAFSTGAWCHPFKRMERMSGVVATVGRANPLQTMVDMRKTRQQVQYTGKVGDARYPHPSHWGKVCFLSTPDGENCGLVKNLATTGLVSTNVLESLIPQLLTCGMEKLVDDTFTSLRGKDKVFLNGDWVGVCEDSLSFVLELRRMRRRKKLPHQVEIKRDVHQGEVRIFSDAGRILRPLLVVENLNKVKSSKGGKSSFQYFLDNGIIELIGAEEEEDCSTAWGIKYLFMEDKGKSAAKFTHSVALSHMQITTTHGGSYTKPRSTLNKQLVFLPPILTSEWILCLTNCTYPQRPLFQTMTSDCLGKPGRHNRIVPKPEYYNGQNAIVAVNVHLGFNQEDSIVMNRASLERGMFRSEHIRSYKAEVDNKESLDKRRKPDDCVNFGKMQSKFGRVDSLDDDGFPYVGANLQSGDIIIGRCSESGADHSIKLKHTERGMVQKVLLSSNDDGKNFAVVSLRQVRSPCLGDKFSSMHGQKGVLGFLESQENFPFTIQGVVPDIVINPHAFPSRQTPGQLLEAALGKGIACGGSKRYATPFSTLSVDDITDQLHSAGFSRWGNERVYNGATGAMVRSLIFMGPTFYQRLIHMSEDKVKFRNTGPVHPLTRQPVADRKRFGGIKFGEMERDCLIAHGASANLHERLFTLSDSSQMHVCQKCKNVAYVILRTVPGGRKIRGPHCRICDSADDLVRVNVPYGAKLLCQELFSMGISLKFETRFC
ncbi:DNA-directed RNA polymerases IV and V subunit 2-like [Prunus yedoensis var. nudiflora]|uniref:DNA-directed RNA polymerase subunit beta n=1 Tax=Prunus yedoensis var. nudiflora TaxID=2094558 RepID=A0A314ZS55_PRUYE|nr:DNA-directed RNA polymerases IV and V subunit 2-like [Prunus yedoensis var. nudiflora]